MGLVLGRDFNPDEVLTVQAQVDKLINQATSLENLCQCFSGWYVLGSSYFYRRSLTVSIGVPSGDLLPPTSYSHLCEPLQHVLRLCHMYYRIAL